LTAENRDYLRVDYNIKDKKIRLYVEVASEGNTSYYSVITNGKITAERTGLSGRSFNCADKIKARANIYATIPDRRIHNLINKNYNIVPSVKTLQRETTYEEPDFASPYSGKDEETPKRVYSRRYVLYDIIDILAGSALSALVFYYLQFSFLALGVSLAFYGISIGVIDVFFREREPVLIKILLFILTGFASYIYGYYIF
jgi:hypothetical protein